MSEESPEPPNRKPTGQRAERKRRVIVAAAREIFVQQGYDAGMDSIADAAGVSKVTIYNHFGSKEQLFTEVISEAFEQAAGDAPGQALAGLAGAGDLVAVQRLRPVFDAVTDLQPRRPELPLVAVAGLELRREILWRTMGKPCAAARIDQDGGAAVPAARALSAPKPVTSLPRSPWVSPSAGSSS